MNTKIPISATILSKNSERYLVQVLDALRDLDEVVLLDNGSEDETLSIAARYPNVVVYTHPFQGFGLMKNLAAEKARNDWIVNIDSDEIVSQTLLQSLHQLDWTEPKNIYTISRLNHYRRRPIRACGWYPDVIPRIYHRKHTRFSDVAVHERINIQPDSHILALSGDLLHYSFDSASALTAKMQHYTDLYAAEQCGKKRSSVSKAVLHGVMAFLKSYLLKRGVRYGGDGLIIATGIAIGSYYKYIKLLEYNQKIPTALFLCADNAEQAQKHLQRILNEVLQQYDLPIEVWIIGKGCDKIKIFSDYPFDVHCAEHFSEAVQQANGKYRIAVKINAQLPRKFTRIHLSFADKQQVVYGGFVQNGLLKWLLPSKIIGGFSWFGGVIQNSRETNHGFNMKLALDTVLGDNHAFKKIYYRRLTVKYFD